MSDNANKFMTPEELAQLTSDILSNIRDLKQRINNLETLLEQFNNSNPWSLVLHTYLKY